MGRVLTFADPEVIKLAQEKFVPVAIDDWYQRRRKDAEGDFFRKVADQGPRKGDGTRQGIYLLTASGRLLGYRNHYDPNVMRGVIRQALNDFHRLPASERAPGAVKVPELTKVDPGYVRKLPKGGIILNVFTRILDKDLDGQYCHGACEFKGGDRAAHDRLWLTADDWQALIPKDPKAGDKLDVSNRLVTRLARFHFVDNTRGEPPHWGKKEIRKANLALEVTKATDDKIEMKLTGDFLLETAKSDRGFDLNILGAIIVDRENNRIERFNMVGLGDHWGAGPFTRKARPGRAPLGLAFELSSGDTPSDLVPPQGARWLQGYLEAERH